MIRRYFVTMSVKLCRVYGFLSLLFSNIQQPILYLESSHHHCSVHAWFWETIFLPSLYFAMSRTCLYLFMFYIFTWLTFIDFLQFRAILFPVQYSLFTLAILDALSTSSIILKRLAFLLIKHFYYFMLLTLPRYGCHRVRTLTSIRGYSAI